MLLFTERNSAKVTFFQPSHNCEVKEDTHGTKLSSKILEKYFLVYYCNWAQILEAKSLSYDQFSVFTMAAFLNIKKPKRKKKEFLTNSQILVAVASVWGYTEFYSVLFCSIINVSLSTVLLFSILISWFWGETNFKTH